MPPATRVTATQTPRLRPLADNLWQATCSLSFPGGVRLPARMTVARSEAGLWLHSPLAIDDELARALEALGPVRFIVAPNKMHHLFVAEAARRFPAAKVYGVPGLDDKCADVKFDALLGSDDASDKPLAHPFGGEFEAVALRGTPSLNEVVYLHRPSQSLITADLVFNVQKPETLGTHLALALMGTRGRLAQSRYFHFYARDKEAMRESLEHVFAWPFRRVVMGHGEVFEAAQAPESLRRTMWMTRNRPPATMRAS